MIYQFRRWPDGRTAFPYASDGIRQIYGVAPADVRDDASRVDAVIHPDDRERLTGVGEQPVAPALAGRVLVVEDDPINQRVIAKFLQRLGLECAIRANGQLGVDAVQDGEPCDLILMDVQMPVMGGYEATQRIRVWEREAAQSRCPIVALTADAFDEDRARCREAGMDDFIAKPVALDELRSVLSRYLGPPDR